MSPQMIQKTPDNQSVRRHIFRAINKSAKSMHFYTMDVSYDANAQNCLLFPKRYEPT